MKPAIEVGDAKVFHGDCRDVLATLSDNSVDSVVTDPPYELGFMGKKWDSSGIAYDMTVWSECLRVLKPGGHLLAFGGSRTYHRLGVAIEDAGFEIRDTIAWISSKTFPKSHNIAKALEKSGRDATAAQGWGTGLKQVVEPVVLARKPLDGTVADNFDLWGVGGLNIDATRIPGRVQKAAANNFVFTPGGKVQDGYVKGTGAHFHNQGRWTANVILDEVSAAVLDEQSGERASGGGAKGVMGGSFGNGKDNPNRANSLYHDTGGASRFFYVAKASKRDRNEGLQDANGHPTVKPTQLMRYLIKLVTPTGGTVLDPFTGSGSTGKAALLDGYKFIGAEVTEEYLPIIEGRLASATQQHTEETLF